MMKISKIDTLYPEKFIPTKDNVSKLLSLNIEVEIGKKAANTPPILEIDEKKLEEIFRKSLVKHFINIREMLLLDYEGSALILTVTNLRVVEQVEDESITKTFGEFDGDTEIRFNVSPKVTKMLRIKSDKIKETELFKTEFNFEKLGIGGLDGESSTIFRRAFNSRRYPPALIRKYGIKHVKGMLLYGPPGTGKTLIARKIAEVLKAHEPKLVNGPEIFSKFVGESEKNIRELFAEAEKEERESGEDSKLHIIIFDEIDAICKPRGSVNSGVAVHDTVVNQILSKLDGVESLNNILVIGMTNRKDMIDEAVLRPGRLEVHVEIGLPDEAGRVQIFRIHTRTMKENGLWVTL
jgi:vesicle-fusing ATPase